MSISTTLLPTRKIGAASVTALGYGAMGISVFYGTVGNDEERLKVRPDLAVVLESNDASN